MSMRMVTVARLFQKMARLVRDLSRKSGKLIEFETVGEETELDRNIVEELADPLMHMVRNAVDHGIETAEERLKTGKEAAARVRLKASHQSGQILIEVSDDGRGLDTERILRKAKDKGLLPEDAQPPESEIFNLIFQPGFSTAKSVTDVSGRGVGMDVVRKHIQKLRGRVEIQSMQGQGTKFLIKLPLTLAIIDGLVVGVGGERYIVPIYAVREMLRPVEEQITTVESRGEAVMVREHLLPLVRLHSLFGVTPRSTEPWESLLIVAEAEDKLFCVMVDELIGKQEVVIKSLGETFGNVPGIAGGAILGDGRVGLILDVTGLYFRRGRET
jgi:two-component system, chemotaxis family, sensor kinase CheA